jgi:hypothetical protein
MRTRNRQTQAAVDWLQRRHQPGTAHLLQSIDRFVIRDVPPVPSSDYSSCSKVEGLPHLFPKVSLQRPSISGKCSHHLRCAHCLHVLDIMWIKLDNHFLYAKQNHSECIAGR